MAICAMHANHVAGVRLLSRRLLPHCLASLTVGLLGQTISINLQSEGWKLSRSHLHEGRCFQFHSALGRQDSHRYMMSIESGGRREGERGREVLLRFGGTVLILLLSPQRMSPCSMRLHEL